MVSSTDYRDRLKEAVMSPKPESLFNDSPGEKATTISSIVETSIEHIRSQTPIVGERIDGYIPKQFLQGEIKHYTLTLIEKHENKRATNVKLILLVIAVVSVATFVFFPVFTPLVGIPLIVLLTSEYIFSREMKKLKTDLNEATTIAMEPVELSSIAYNRFENILKDQNVPDAELGELFQIDAREKMQNIAPDGIVYQFAVDAERVISYTIIDKDLGLRRPIVVPSRDMTDKEKRAVSHSTLVDLEEPEWIKPIESVCNQISLLSFLHVIIAEFNISGFNKPITFDEKNLALEIKNSETHHPFEMTIERNPNLSIKQVNFVVKMTMDFATKVMDVTNEVKIIEKGAVEAYATFALTLEKPSNLEGGAASSSGETTSNNDWQPVISDYRTSIKTKAQRA